MGESLRTPSLGVFYAFHIDTEFKGSNVTKAEPFEGTGVNSFANRFKFPQNWNCMSAHRVSGLELSASVQNHILTKRFVCLQIWNWRFAHLVDGSEFHSIVHKCSMDHDQVLPPFSTLDGFVVQRLESIVEGWMPCQNMEAENPGQNHLLLHSKDQMGLRPLSTRLEALQVKDSLEATVANERTSQQNQNLHSTDHQKGNLVETSTVSHQVGTWVVGSRWFG